MAKSAVKPGKSNAKPEPGAPARKGSPEPAAAGGAKVAKRGVAPAVTKSSGKAPAAKAPAAKAPMAKTAPAQPTSNKPAAGGKSTGGKAPAGASKGSASKASVSRAPASRAPASGAPATKAPASKAAAGKVAAAKPPTGAASAKSAAKPIAGKAAAPSAPSKPAAPAAPGKPAAKAADPRTSAAAGAKGAAKGDAARASGAKSKSTAGAATEAPAAKPAAGKPSAGKLEASAASTRSGDGPKAKSAAPKSPAIRPAGAKSASSPWSALSSKNAGAARSVAAAAAAVQQTDAQGYVMINGRLVRMISAKDIAVPRKKKDGDAKPVAEPAAVDVTTVKTKLSSKELEHYSQLLLTRRAEILGLVRGMEQEALRGEGGNLSHMPIHMADIGSDTAEQDFALNLAEKERETLAEIDAALQRVDSGTYGVCQATGKPIPKARLDAKPWAKYTIEAARMFESGHRF